MIDRLISWFKFILQKVGCDVDFIFEEWFLFKVFVNIIFRDKDYISVWEIMFIKLSYKEDFKNFFYFVEIMLVQLILVVQCERVIFVQNRVKNSFRVVFGFFTFEDLIRIIVEGLSVEEFNLVFVVDKWFLRDREAGER